VSGLLTDSDQEIAVQEGDILTETEDEESSIKPFILRLSQGRECRLLWSQK
jgi:hypothetical protein